MRYAIINMGLDLYARFGDFQPASKATAFSGEEGTRYSDAQPYAMALYIYSLESPANPHLSNELTRPKPEEFPAEKFELSLAGTGAERQRIMKLKAIALELSRAGIFKNHGRDGSTRTKPKITLRPPSPKAREAASMERSELSIWPPAHPQPLEQQYRIPLVVGIFQPATREAEAPPVSPIPAAAIQAFPGVR